MATVRMTEKEAIERGLIPASAALEDKNKPKGAETRYLRIPVEVTRYRKGFTIWHAAYMIGGWLLGFAMGLRFGMIF
jgi:hypothetical protein